MRLWTYATIERAEYQVHRRILTHRKWHECCPVEFNLAKVVNGTTQPHRCRVSDCITTTLAEQRQISPGELPIDRNATDRFFRQFEQLCEPRSIDQEDEFAHDCVVQITNRWLQAPTIIREKSNASVGGSPPNSDAFRRQSEIACSVSRSSPTSSSSGLLRPAARSRASGPSARDGSGCLIEEPRKGLLSFSVNRVGV